MIDISFVHGGQNTIDLILNRILSPSRVVCWVAVFLVTQHSINSPNWGLHLTPLRGAGEAGRSPALRADEQGAS